MSNRSLTFPVIPDIDINDFTSPINTKRTLSSNQSSKCKKKKKGTYILKTRFSLFLSNEPEDVVKQNTNMELEFKNSAPIFF